MRKYKYMRAQFTFYDRTGIQRILEEKAEKGWLLDKVSNFGWRFRRIEPKKIHFAVTYFPPASAYDSHPSERQQDLIDFCDHSGWKLIGTAAQMQTAQIDLVLFFAARAEKSALADHIGKGRNHGASLSVCNFF